MTQLLEAAAKAALILVVALGAVACSRRRSAALRHWILAVATLTALIAPALAFRPPVWTIPVAAGTVGATSTTMAIVVDHASEGAPGSPPSLSARGFRAWRPRLVVAAVGVWGLGAGLGILMLALGLARMAHRARRSTPLTERRWVHTANDLSRGFRRRPRLLQGDARQPLVTWGFWRPVVCLPAGAASWTDERIRVVLRHELAHIRRGDWLTQMLAEVLRAIHWFNPVAWIAAACLRRESECACDDEVLSNGVSASDYATHLLDLARAAQHLGSWSDPAPAMARPSSLERRFAAMLNHDTNRTPLTTRSRLFTMLIVLLASALVAGVGIGRAQTFSTLSGSVLDSTNRVIPNVTLTITDPRNGAKHEVTSDGTGHFEFVGLPPGEYRVEAVRPGFANLRDSVVVVGPGVQKNLVLDVGTLLETITVAGTANPAPNDGTGGAPGSSRPARQPSVACEPTAVGGNIRPPVKLLDMRPDYPEALQRAGIEGVVIMNALVGADGLVRDVEVLREANPDLARAAATAVRQWVFSETLLNCEPTDVRLLVTTNFVIRP